jgi:hypothetical protein
MLLIFMPKKESSVGKECKGPYSQHFLTKASITSVDRLRVQGRWDTKPFESNDSNYDNRIEMGALKKGRGEKEGEF